MAHIAYMSLKGGGMHGGYCVLKWGFTRSFLRKSNATAEVKFEVIRFL